MFGENPAIAAINKLVVFGCLVLNFFYTPVLYGVSYDTVSHLVYSRYGQYAPELMSGYGLVLSIAVFLGLSAVHLSIWESIKVYGSWRYMNSPH